MQHTEKILTPPCLPLELISYNFDAEDSLPVVPKPLDTIETLQKSPVDVDSLREVSTPAANSVSHEVAEEQKGRDYDSPEWSKIHKDDGLPHQIIREKRNCSASHHRDAQDSQSLQLQRLPYAHAKLNWSKKASSAPLKETHDSSYSSHEMPSCCGQKFYCLQSSTLGSSSGDAPDRLVLTKTAALDKLKRLRRNPFGIFLSHWLNRRGERKIMRSGGRQAHQKQYQLEPKRMPEKSRSRNDSPKEKKWTPRIMPSSPYVSQQGIFDVPQALYSCGPNKALAAQSPLTHDKCFECPVSNSRLMDKNCPTDFISKLTRLGTPLAMDPDVYSLNSRQSSFLSLSQIQETRITKPSHSIETPNRLEDDSFFSHSLHCSPQQDTWQPRFGLASVLSLSRRSHFHSICDDDSRFGKNFSPNCFDNSFPHCKKGRRYAYLLESNSKITNVCNENSHLSENDATHDESDSTLSAWESLAQFHTEPNQDRNHTVIPFENAGILMFPKFKQFCHSDTTAQLSQDAETIKHKGSVKNLAEDASFVCTPLFNDKSFCFSSLPGVEEHLSTPQIPHA